MSPLTVLKRLQTHRLGLVLRLPPPPLRGPLSDDVLERVAADLLDHFRATDEQEAFVFLVELTQQRVLAIARRIVRAQSSFLDPEELVAAFMTNLFTDLRPNQPRVKHLLGLAYTIMKFEALTQLRGQRRVRRRQERYSRLNRESALLGDPSDEVERREAMVGLRRQGTLLLSIVGRCFEGLSDRDRRVLSLREIEGLTYDDLALRMDVPRSQVGMVLKRARGRLARTIDETMDALGGRRRPDADLCGTGPRMTSRPSATLRGSLTDHMRERSP